jgi:hypothetical protein
MSLSGEITALQEHLEELARTPDDELLARYTMQPPRRPSGFYWQLRWLAGRTLRWLASQGILQSDPWPVSLKHAATNSKAKPLLIWAIGVDRSTLREACGGFSAMLDDLPGFAPVLVTDVADFAFFSRLGWLVEYLPTVAGHGEIFAARKARFVARLYRGVPVLPASAGLEIDCPADNLRQLLMSGGLR